MALKWSFISDTGKENLYGHCSGLLGGRALQVSRLYSEDILKMADHLVVKLGKRLSGCFYGLLGDKPLKLVELYLGDGLGKAGHLTMTLMRDSPQAWSTHIMDFNCMSLCATWQSNCATVVTLMIGLKSGLERKKVMFHVMVLKDRF